LTKRGRHRWTVLTNQVRAAHGVTAAHKPMGDDAGVSVAAPTRVSLFITCFNDTLFPQTGRATVELLERLGVAVDFPLEQTCCGQMHFNTGYAQETIPLVRRFVRVFGDSEVVVSPSASCVAMVREHYPRVAELAGDHRLQEEVGSLRPRVLELSELLVDRLGVEDVGAFFPHRVTYHPTCHSLRMLHVGERPLQLLKAVKGIEVVELPEARECCGFGGTFAIKNADTSTAMLTDKIRAILDTGAEVCVSADNSCLMHIGGALSRQRAGVRAVHLAEILAQTEPRRGGAAAVAGPSPAARQRAP
jgi:L-lactate dehydrogenase complex protein LldE